MILRRGRLNGAAYCDMRRAHHAISIGWLRQRVAMPVGSLLSRTVTGQGRAETGQGPPSGSNRLKRTDALP
jgi:hypothetical protein